MDDTQTRGLAGLFRVLYFLVIAALVISIFAVGIPAVYEPPSADISSQIPASVRSRINIAQDPDAGYNRNLGLIFTIVGTAVAVAAVAGLAAPYNALRCGLLGGAIIVFIGGVEDLSNGKNEWLALLMPIVALVCLLAVARWRETGSPRALGQPRPPAAPAGT